MHFSSQQQHLYTRRRGSILAVALMLGIALLFTGLGVIKFIGFNRIMGVRVVKSSQDMDILFNVHQILASEIAQGHSQLTYQGTADDPFYKHMDSFFYQNSFDGTQFNGRNEFSATTNFFAKVADAETQIPAGHKMWLNYINPNTNNQMEIFIPKTGSRQMYLKTIIVAYPYNYNMDALNVFINPDRGRRQTDIQNSVSEIRFQRRFFLRQPLDQVGFAYPNMGPAPTETLRVLDVFDPFDFNSYPKRLLVQTIGTYLSPAEIADPNTFNNADVSTVANAGIYRAPALQEEFVIDKEGYSDFALMTPGSLRNERRLNVTGNGSLTIIGKAYIPGIDATGTAFAALNASIRFDNTATGDKGTLLTHYDTVNDIPVPPTVSAHGGSLNPNSAKRFNSIEGHRLKDLNTVPDLFDLSATSTTWGQSVGLLSYLYNETGLNSGGSAAGPTASSPEFITPFNTAFPCEAPGCGIDIFNRESALVNYSFGFPNSDNQDQHTLVPQDQLYKPNNVRDPLTNGSFLPVPISPSKIPMVSLFNSQQIKDYGGGHPEISQGAVYFASISSAITGGEGYKIIEGIGQSIPTEVLGVEDVDDKSTFRVTLLCNENAGDHYEGVRPDVIELPSSLAQKARDSFWARFSMNRFCVRVAERPGKVAPDNWNQLVLSANINIPFNFVTLDHKSEDYRYILTSPSWGHYIQHNPQGVPPSLTANDASVWSYPIEDARFNRLTFSEKIINQPFSGKNNLLQMGDLPEDNTTLYMRPWLIDNVEAGGTNNELVPTFGVFYNWDKEPCLKKYFDKDGATPEAQLKPECLNFNYYFNSFGAGGTVLADKSFGFFGSNESQKQQSRSMYMSYFYMSGLKQLISRKSAGSDASLIVLGDKDSTVTPLLADNKTQYILGDNGRVDANNTPAIPFYLSRIGLDGDYKNVRLIRIMRENKKFDVNSFGAIYDDGPYTIIVKGDLTIDTPIHSYDSSIRMGIIVLGNVNIVKGAENYTKVGKFCKGNRLDAFIMASGAITFDGAIAPTNDPCQNVAGVTTILRNPRISNNKKGNVNQAYFLISGGLYSGTSISFAKAHFVIHNLAGKDSFQRPPGFSDTGVYSVTRTAKKQAQFSFLAGGRSAANIRSFFDPAVSAPIPLEKME